MCSMLLTALVFKLFDAVEIDIAYGLFGLRDTLPLAIVIAAHDFGILFLAATVLAYTLAAEADRMRITDPRWDVRGFEQWAEAGSVAFLKVSHLRELAAAGREVPTRRELSGAVAYIGAPPRWVQVFAIDAHSADAGAGATRLAARQCLDLIDEHAFDDDCCFIEAASLFKDPQSRHESKCRRNAASGLVRVHCFYRIRKAIIPPVAYEGSAPLHERGPAMFNLALSMYCVRIVNAASEEVQRGVDPTRYINLRQMAHEASALHPSALRPFGVC